MSQFIESLYRQLITPYQDKLIMLGAALVIALLAIRILLPMLIKAVQRWRNWDGQRKILVPKTWFKMQSKAHFKALSSLLANHGLREIYAPSSAERFIGAIEEGKKAPMGAAWLSPYSRAVRAAIRSGKTPSGTYLKARKQIAEMASKIRIGPLPEEHGGGIDDAEHYQITLEFDGRGEEEIAKLTGKVQSQLGLHALKALPGQKGGFAISYAAHKVEEVDPLTSQKIGVDFLERNRSNELFQMTAALSSKKKVYHMPMTNILVVGRIGSGKGSPIHAAIRHLSHFKKEGLVKLYGVDPKEAELPVYAASSLFEEVVYETPDAVELIFKVHAELMRRQRSKKPNFETYDAGRSLKVSKQNPVIYLVIDELLSLMLDLNAERDKSAIRALTQIMIRGRALNIFILGAVQEADKEALGRLRSSFVCKIVLGQDNPYINDDIMLYKGAAEDGYDSTAIIPAEGANGYATAGIGYVMDNGKPLKIRFAYSSDKDVMDLARAFPKGVSGLGAGTTLLEAAGALERPSLAKAAIEVDAEADAAAGGLMAALDRFAEAKAPQAASGAPGSPSERRGGLEAMEEAMPALDAFWS